MGDSTNPWKDSNNMVNESGANGAGASASDPQPAAAPGDGQDSGADTVESLKTRLLDLDRQYKGQQRTNERLRQELNRRLDSDHNSQELRLLGERVEKFTKLIEPHLTASAKEESERLSAATAAARQRLAEESKAQRKIADTLAEHGIDFDDPEAQVAKAFYEAGKFDRVEAELDKVVSARKAKTSVSEAEVQARVEEELKKRGAAVRTGGSTAGSGAAPGTVDVKAVLSSPKASQEELMAAMRARVSALKKG